MNRKSFAVMSLIILGTFWMAQRTLHAEPERLALKADSQKANTAQAETLAKAVDLTSIQDPQVKTALEAVFKALGLQSQTDTTPVTADISQ